MVKHSWHCGICETDLQVLKKKKGTKYLFCPHCDKITAYYNKGLLKKVAKGALRSIPFVGDIGAEILTKEQPSLKSPTPQIRRVSSIEQLERYSKLNKQR